MKPKKTLKLSPEDEAKVLAAKRRLENESIPIDEYQYAIARFGIMYGWQAIEAVLNNQINAETMMWLLMAGERVENKQRIELAESTTIGTTAANSKNPKRAFETMTRDIARKAKIDI